MADSAPLTVFRVHGKLTEQVAATQLDKYGKGTVELEPGNYIFEVMHRPEGNLLVVLRSPETKIDSASEVRLQGGAPRKLELLLNGRSSGKFLDFAIRSAGPTGTLQWSSPEGARRAAPRLACSPNIRPFARILAKDGTDHFAVWQHLSRTKPWQVSILQEDLTPAHFSWIDSTPKGKTSWVQLEFPDSRIRVEQPEDAMLFTNRRFVHLSYGYETKRGKQVAFLPRAYDLPLPPEKFNFILGGALTASASAKVLKRKVVKRPETQSLVWTVDLTDLQGHNLDQKNSDIRWQASIGFLDGKALPGGPLSDKLLGKLKTPHESLEIKIGYAIGKSVRFKLQPKEWSTFTFGHFKTLAPPSWGPRVMCYLSKLERVHKILGEIEGTRKTGIINLQWITNMAGWGREGLMMM
ncbi:MAG: hypothetical protein JKY61_08960, partial [Planctomycetes bacterium]|nr:hypothetical protein [Planctomycetota bacterium]